MAKLINGNGNPAVYAAEDSDYYASVVGNQTCISRVGSQMAATAQDANTIGVADGVCITKEGRRIQLDDGLTDIFIIPTGESGVTNYYIIGYKLKTAAYSSQTCETFVQKMNSSSETIQEDTFRGGAIDVYVSLYRVTQDGFNLDTIEPLLPTLEGLSQLNASLTERNTTYYNGKLYVLNADGTRGDEIKLGSQNNFTLILKSNSVPQVIDISDFSNTQNVYMGFYYVANANSNSINVQETISTVKTWSNHEIALSSSVKIKVTYSSGSLQFYGNNDHVICGAVSIV